MQGWAMGRPLLNPALFGVMTIACAIAAIAPFDVMFSAISFGSVFVRVAVMALVVLLGWKAACKVGLRLEGHGAEHPALVGIAAAIIVAVCIIVIDCYLFRSLLAPKIVQSIQQPVILRLAYFMLRAFNENVIYRLFVFSVLVLALTRLRIASPQTVAAAMVVTQCINIGLNIPAEEASMPLLFYYALRYLAPGVLWAWLYLRFGFKTAEIASVGCHVFLQPMFSVFF